MSKTRHMCSFQGCGRISTGGQIPAHQGPNSSEDIRTARQYVALPANDGIIWTHSSQYSGLTSIYLQGVCWSLPFYLSKHIWCPVADDSNRNVCFPEDAFSLFMLFFTLWLPSARKERGVLSEQRRFGLVWCHDVIFLWCIFHSDGC